MDIVVKRGLPISCVFSDRFESPNLPALIRLEFSAFRPSGFVALIKEGDQVNAGDPLAQHLLFSDLLFVSPVSGTVQNIVYFRGRRPSFIEIAVSKKQHAVSLPKVSPGDSSIEIIRKLANSGLLSGIRVLPFDVLPDPKELPRAIFVNACEDLFHCNVLEILKKHGKALSAGLRILGEIAPNNVHVVCSQNCEKFIPIASTKGACLHRMSGIYPGSHASVHVHHVAPIVHVDDCVWTLSLREAIAIGHASVLGQVFPYDFCSVFSCEPMIRSLGLVETVLGSPLQHIMDSLGLPNCEDGFFVSGDLFLGKEVRQNGFLRVYDHALGCFSKDAVRNVKKNSLWSSLEIMPFSSQSISALPLDPSIYEYYCPMDLPVASLVRACLGEDFSEAVSLGLLELSQKDAAIFSAVCPARFNFVQAMTKGWDRGFLDKHPDYCTIQ